MIRKVKLLTGFLTIIFATAMPSSSQTKSDLQAFFQKDIELSQDQISDIHSGKAIAKALPSRAPSEVFLFGAIYIHGAPESYLLFARDYDRLRKLPNYLAIGKFSEPPKLSDLKGFAFENEDMKTLKNCKTGDCSVQMPTYSIEHLKQSIDWSAPDASERVNQILRMNALDRLRAYQREGNQALGVYNDKPDPTEVSKQFAYMLTYDKALPNYLPDFYHYLLSYPKDKPANTESTFYWSMVNFGLKPTLRVVQVVTLHGNKTDDVAYAIAEKQLYSSHYFETALDLTFCVRGNEGGQGQGFYLIMALGSEQAGLTGVKGSLIRKVAVGRSVSSLRDALTTIKTTLENDR